MSEEVLVTVEASLGRRSMGIGTLLLLGAMLLYLGLTLPADLMGKIFLIVFGALSIWGADAMRRATSSSIELRRDGLYDQDGTLIAPVDKIKQMDRGMLAFKPSNGFILVMSEPMPRAWRPGLWWRFGRRVGVGGVTSAGMTKGMSEILSTLITPENG